jgi:hypothetical protein
MSSMTGGEGISEALEKHFRVRELAALWGFCDNTIIRVFANEPGVIRLDRSVGRRKYTTLSIPESVALRVHERLGNQPLQPELSGGNPLRIIRLGYLDGTVSKKPRNVLKVHPAKQLPHREGVAESVGPAVR